VRQKIKLQQGIPSDKARQIAALVKEMKLKAQASIQGDAVRVVSKDRDTLQQINGQAARRGLRRDAAVHQLPQLAARAPHRAGRTRQILQAGDESPNPLPDLLL